MITLDGRHVTIGVCSTFITGLCVEITADIMVADVTEFPGAAGIMVADVTEFPGAADIMVADVTEFPVAARWPV